MVASFAGWETIGAAQSDPLSGRAPVELAAGIAEMPATEIAWRIVEDVAEPPGQAAFEQRALGFAMLPTAPIRITNQATGRQRVIDERGAAFVADGVTERRESLVNGAASYLRVALVSSEKRDDPGGDRLIFAGDPFPAPTGSREMTLYLDDLDLGDSATLIGSGSPFLVLVVQGSATIESDAGVESMTTVVGSGTSYAAGSFDGAVQIVAERNATVLVIATIGEPV